MYQLREIIQFVRENANMDSHGGYVSQNLEIIISKIYADVLMYKTQRQFENISILTEKQLYKVVCREIDTRNVLNTDLIVWNNKTLAINEIKLEKLQYFYRVFLCTEFEKDGRQI